MVAGESRPVDPVIAAMQAVERIDLEWASKFNEAPLDVIHEWTEAHGVIDAARDAYESVPEHHDAEPPAWKIYEIVNRQQ